MDSKIVDAGRGAAWVLVNLPGGVDGAQKILAQTIEHFGPSMSESSRAYLDATQDALDSIKKACDEVRQYRHTFADPDDMRSFVEGVERPGMHLPPSAHTCRGWRYAIDLWERGEL